MKKVSYFEAKKHEAEILKSLLIKELSVMRILLMHKCCEEGKGGSKHGKGRDCFIKFPIIPLLCVVVV